MSDRLPSDPSAQSAWSLFETFEMPTSNVSFELPQEPVAELPPAEEAVEPEAITEEPAVAELTSEEPEYVAAVEEVAPVEAVVEAQTPATAVEYQEEVVQQIAPVVADEPAAPAETPEPPMSVIDRIRGAAATEPEPVVEAVVAPEPEVAAEAVADVEVSNADVAGNDSNVPHVEIELAYDDDDSVLRPPPPRVPAPEAAKPKTEPKPKPAAVPQPVTETPAVAATEAEEFISTQQVTSAPTPDPVESQPTPIAPQPVAEKPVTHTPALTAPVHVAPAAPAPVASTPEPAPVHVAPVAPAPVAPTPEPAPAYVAPVAPTPAPAAAARVASAPTAPAAAGPVQVTPTGESGEVLFRDLPLLEEVQQAIERSGYTTPTEIQAQIIPFMLDGRDVLAQSQTGTGKTAAFALPILSRIDLNKRHPQVLVLTPTRELAIQVGKSFQTYGADLPGFTVATIYGGSDYDPQLRQLRRGAHVVVGTPGRTIDHIKRGTLKLDGITCLALDEADEMLNMGFLDDVKFVLERAPDDRQIALFSATMPGPIRTIAQQYLNNPARITVKAKTMTADSIRQRAVIVQPRDKVDTLIRLLDVEDTDGVIIFTKTREATVTVAEALSQSGLSAVALNGDIPQKLRERTIQQLKSGKLDILVATDVAARGLDVQRISHVFNYDVPNDSESYVHRIGRTGRAGRKGEAIIFLSNSQRYKLRTIERATRQPIEVVQPPTADDMNAIRIVRFKEQIASVMAEQDLSLFHRLITEHAEESGKPMEYIAAALAHIGQGGRPFFVEDRPRRKSFDREERSDFRSDRGRSDRGNYGDRGDRGGRAGGPPPRRLSAPRPGMERFRIEVGSSDGVKPGNIVGAVANEGGIDGDQIGPISIHQSHSTVDLPTGMPKDIYETLQQTWVAGKQLKLSRDTGERASDGGGHRGSGGGHRQGGSGKRPFVKRGGQGGAPGAKFRKRKTRPRD